MFRFERSEIVPGQVTYPQCMASAGGFAIVAAANAIWHSEDGGDSWHASKTRPTGNWPRGAWASEDGLAAVVGDGVGVQVGMIAVSEDGGRSFAVQNSPSKAPLYDVVGDGSDRLWAVGANGAILSSVDRGRSWKSQAVVPQLLSGICRDGDGRLWVSGTGGTILTSGDGETWEVVRQKGRAYLYGIAVTDSGTLVAPAGNGSVFLSMSGEKWTSKRTGTKAYFYAGAACTGDDVWVAGAERPDAVVLRLDGKKWVPADLEDVGREIFGLHAVSEDELWVTAGEWFYRGRRA